MNIVAGYNDNPASPETRTICRFYLKGMCRFGNRCRNVHGEIGHVKTSEKIKTPEQRKPRGKSKTPRSQEKNSPGSSSEAKYLSPSNVNKNLTAEYGPSTSSEKEAIALVKKVQSGNKSCGICFDKIVEKTEKREQVFGILPNCNHCYCFPCIRKWRQSKEFDFDVAKGCPECRVASEYVYPSKYWFEVKEEKDTFITNEKTRMQKIDCKYFRKGASSCPFGNTCLYLHALPNGTKMDVGPPRPRRRRSSNIDHEIVHQILFWLNDDDDDDLDLGGDDDFDLDLDDPTIAMQYYDHDDIRRYIAIDRLMNPGGSDTESDDIDYLF